MPFPTRFPGSELLASPMHSISIPFSAGVAVPLSVDVNEVALVPGPNSAPELALKSLLGPQIEVEVDLCTREQFLFPPSLQVVFPLTLQTVIPSMFPVTLQVKVKGSLGQVRGARVKCPVTSPEGKQ